MDALDVVQRIFLDFFRQHMIIWRISYIYGWNKPEVKVCNRFSTGRLLITNVIKDKRIDLSKVEIYAVLRLYTH